MEKGKQKYEAKSLLKLKHQSNGLKDMMHIQTYIN